MDATNDTTTFAIEDMLDGIFVELLAYEQSDTFKGIATDQERRQRLVWAKAMREYNQRYPQARLLRAQAQPYKMALYRRQGGLCYLCHAELAADIQIDHIHPIVDGGTSEPSNLCVVHHVCNSRKGARPQAPNPLPAVSSVLSVQLEMF